MPDGAPDSSFGENGIYIDSTKAQTNAYDVVEQADGKLVVCGNYFDDFSGEGFPYPLVARYDANGRPDKNFGDNGKVIQTGSAFTPVTLALQRDGKIVCGGANITPSKSIFKRFNSDGSLDKNFGINGIVETDFTKYLDYYSDIAIQEDDRIVAVGTAQDNSGNLNLRPQMAAARYNPDGSLDETFDQDGKTMIPFAIYTLGKSLALQPDGKMVISGTTGNDGFDYCVGRLNTDGSLDAEFGTDGKTITDINGNSYDDVYQVGLQSTGNIIVSGITVTDNLYSGVLARYVGGEAENTVPIAKIKSWLHEHALNWKPIYTSGNIDFYSIEKSKSRSGGFAEVKRYEAEALPQPLVTGQTATYAYNLATDATANATSVSYYRIRAVYNNGSSVYSDVVSDSLLVQNNTITISPNPAKNVMKISGLHPNQKSTISIINRNGNVVLAATAYSSTQNINIAQLRSGVYNVVVTAGGKTQTVKMMKE